VFVLRVWLEGEGGPAEGGARLRGSVQRVDEGVDESRVRYFASLERLPELLRGLAGWPPPAEGPTDGPATS
jgi:hypothetical protein